MNTFSDWLEKIMEERKLGVNQLAEYAHVSPSAISKVRLGQRNPNSDTVKKLAHYFKIDEDWLLELAGHRTGYAPEEEAYKIQDPVLRALVNADTLNKLSLGGRRAIISIIQAEMEDFNQQKSEPSLQDAMLQRLQEAPPLDMGGVPEENSVKKTSQRKKASNRDSGK